MNRYVLAVVLSFSMATAAAANPLTVSATVGGIATGPDLSFITFDDPLETAALTVGLDKASIVSGTTGVHADPYFSNNQGRFFGETPVNGPDATNYLAIEKDGKATFAFKSPQTYFGLLWGSVDNYNDLSFYNAQGGLIGTISGDDVEPRANGNQGLSGTYYVNVVSSVAFSTVVASSSNIAFEIDDVAYDPPPSRAIPEPASLPLLAAAFIGMGLIARRRCGASRSLLAKY